MFTLDLARAHIRDLQRAADRSHRVTQSRRHARLRRLADRAANR